MSAEETCAKCYKEIDTLTPHKEFDNQILCNDCYYAAVGVLVEEHPIGSPMHRNDPLTELQEAAKRYYEEVWCPVEEPKNSDEYRHALCRTAIAYGRTISDKKVLTSLSGTENSIV